MTLLEKHQEAMRFSFLAKQEREIGMEERAVELYTEAAKIESEVAEYYFSNPDTEPTRSVIIRSAAFLNLKAGNIAQAEKYIFWGLVNASDELIKSQLYDALELCLAFKGFKNEKEVSNNVDYIYKLRQKSEFYTIEPQTPEHGTAVTLEMISDFSLNYTKSLKAYSKSSYKDFFADKFSNPEAEEKAADQFQQIINPVLTSAGFGSFKFAVAAEFLAKPGETKEITILKSNIVHKYHREVFTQEFSDENIDKIKQNFSSDEIDEIFRPLFNIRSNKTEYKVAYIDRETFKRSYVGTTKNSQKKKLLPVRTIDSKEIGQLESTITHKRGTHRNVILKQEMKAYSFDYVTKFIEPKNVNPIILLQEIVINVDFNSNSGFTFSFDDLPVQANSIEYNEGLNLFHIEMINFIKNLNLKENKTDLESKYWEVLKRLITNPETIK